MNQERVLFRESKAGTRLVRGAIIKKIQNRLAGLNYYSKKIDGIFGKESKLSTSLFQKDNVLTQSGAIDLKTWNKLFSNNSIPSMFDRCLQVTADMEGHGFGKASGNFDNAGLTWGIIGFTLFNCEIQSILNDVRTKHPLVWKSCCGNNHDELVDVLSKSLPEQMDWADSISTGAKKANIEPRWEETFACLGDQPEVQNIQMEKTMKYWQMARRDFSKIGFTEELSIALCFDIAVQNGGVSDEEYHIILNDVSNENGCNEETKRKIVARAIAMTSLEEWKADVLARKTTFAVGNGLVHGDAYELEAWGLRAEPCQP